MGKTKIRPGCAQQHYRQSTGLQHPSGAISSNIPNDGNIPMDNNYAEQAIRPFTIGRKNFVLIESSNGARASAMIYSLVETAKANHLNVYQYFELLLTEIPKHMNDTSLDFIDDLLPWTPSVQETCPSRFKNLNFSMYKIYRNQLTPCRNAGFCFVIVLSIEGLLDIYSIYPKMNLSKQIPQAKVCLYSLIRLICFICVTNLILLFRKLIQCDLHL